ncbi:MAG: rod shape-determining protein MreC [Pseudomonadota bacterium]
MQSALFSKLGRSGLREAERPPANLLVLLAVSFFLTIVSIYGAQASVFEKARESLLDRFAPVLNVFSAPVRYVGNRIGDVSDYFAVLEENERLREENEALRIWMHQAMAMEQRLAEYETLLNSRVVDANRYIPAQVIAENGGPFRRALILSAGREAGVREGNAVVDGGGLIGHVITVGKNASRVLLLTDTNSHVPVYIEAVDTEGLLTGNSGSRIEIKEFSGRPKGALQVGMRVVTSGTDGTLPRGIPVGEISRLTEKGVEVRPYSSGQGAYLVRVIEYAFPDPSEAEGDEDALGETAAVVGQKAGPADG